MRRICRRTPSRPPDHALLAPPRSPATSHLSGDLRSQRVLLRFRHHAGGAGRQVGAPPLARRGGRPRLAGRARFHVRSVPEGLDGVS